MVINENNVYQEGDRQVLALIESIVADLAMPGSGVGGMEHLRELYQKAKDGASCLLLPEHYSNLDLPGFVYCLRGEKDGGAEIADAIAAIAGMKLSESSQKVSAITSAYTRIVICPSRSIENMSEQDKQEFARAMAINRAAMKALNEVKHNGRLILVFPSGTRYRPWDPGSKRGVREIDSYIRSFDYMCLVAVNGMVLHIRKEAVDMTDDYVSPAILRYTAGPVLKCAAFRDEVKVRSEAANLPDKKQAVVDEIMSRLEIMHNEAATP
jgi:glycerol-3-phosphate O-acyltransferase